MLGSGWLRTGLAIAALGFAVHALPAGPPRARAYGERLVAEYSVPAETVARYASFVPTPPSAAHSRRLHLQVADKVAWTGPLQAAGSARNPYTLVLTVSGVARAAGDVASLWQAGWEVRESAVAHREVTVPIAEIARAGVAAGTHLTLSAASTPMSFRDPRDMAAMVGLVSATNFDISDVRVQVWSGAAPLAWPEVSLSRTALLALAASWLLVVLGLKVWQRSSQTAQARMVPMPKATVDVFLPDVPPPAAAPAVEDAPRVAAPQARQPPPSHQARITAALSELLTIGLSVRNVLDETRPPKPRA
jgi:hypothetical protein